MRKLRKPPPAVTRALAGLAMGLVLTHAATSHAQTPLQPATSDSRSPAAPQTSQFDIPAQSLGSALALFARQSGREMLYTPDVVQGRTASAVTGAYTLEAAIAQLLEGTDLDFMIATSGGIVIGDRAALDAYRARLRNTEGSSAIPTDGEAHAALSGAVDPIDSEAGINDTGRATTANVEVARQGGIEEIIVTGQKREERIQDVPIAISAFSSEDLNNQKIEGGFDLLRAVPNVTFSKTNFTGYNFQIRGIGTQAVSATTDPGVAVSFNNTTLIVNRLFEQEYLDIERVEVLRGPQGTLFGRNATAGVINVISAKPKFGVYEGEVKIETGNYGAERLRGHYNLPIGDNLALRGAFASTVRDGYGKNEYDGSDVDNRDLWTGRLSLGWQPHERLRANLLWERFREDDQRVRSIKQLCHRDEGLTHVGGFDLSTLPVDRVNGDGYSFQEVFQAQLTQGCLPGSLYDDAAFGVPNGSAIPFVAVGRLSAFAGTIGFNPYKIPSTPPVTPPCDIYKYRGALSFINLCHEDPFAGAVQSRDLRTISSEIKPTYNARSDIFELSLDFDVNDDLLLSSQTVYVRDGVRSTQDINRFATTPGFFEDTASACGAPFMNPTDTCNPGDFAKPDGFSQGVMAAIAPGGVFCDPQLGCSDRYRAVDLSRSESTQFNQELRLVSAFDGPLNYSIGANFTRFTTMNDYFVFINTLSALSMTAPFRGVISGPTVTGNLAVICPDGPPKNSELYDCLYRDPQTLDELAKGGNPEGHNYFLSRNPYELNSTALFGELYWNATDTLKITGGLRVTWDQKTFTPVPSQALLGDFRKGMSQFTDPSQCVLYSTANLCARMGSAVDGRGYPRDPDIVQEWLEPTGRLGFDWKPELSSDWLDESLIYAFYTRGYKAGGANPPGMSEPSRSFIERAQGAVMPRVFEAEYVNAFEIGTKNRLFGNTLTANANLFYYDYENYQVSKIVNRSSANENFDAKVWGAELELMFAPWRYTMFNAAVGYLRTRIADGEESIDLMDRTQGGGSMFVTGQLNPNFDPMQTPRAQADYVSGLNAPTDQQFLAFDEWVLIKPSVLQTSNCIAPAALVRAVIETHDATAQGPDALSRFCPGGTFIAQSFSYQPIPGTDSLLFNSLTDAPNGGAGFMADLGGRELPSAPRYTVSLGGQQSIPLPGGWDITGRVDWYWQDQSYARVYNTEYDRLKAWTNTNLSLWVSQPALGLRIEAYVKNVFDETPITGTFLGSDDTALPTNAFTLDPRLIGVSVTKQF